jgi:hypothetical protein
MHLLEEGAHSAADLVQPATTREEAKEVTLTIAQLAGRALKAMDSSLFGAGTSDPYVTFTVAVGDSEDKAKRVQTKVIKKNCNPEWLDETLQLQVSMADIVEGVLRVRVFDKDLVGADDLIGEVLVALSAVSAKEFVAPRWLPILDESQTKTGEIRLQLALPPLAKPQQDASSSSNVLLAAAPAARLSEPELPCEMADATLDSFSRALTVALSAAEAAVVEGKGDDAVVRKGGRGRRRVEDLLYSWAPVVRAGQDERLPRVISALAGIKIVAIAAGGAHSLFLTSKLARRQRLVARCVLCVLCSSSTVYYIHANES